MLSLRDSIRRTFSKTARRGRAATPSLKVEALETRQLLSTFALSTAGVLTSGSNQIDENVASYQTDTAGDLVELKTNGNLWELSGGAWTMLDQKVGSFEINSSGVLEEVKTNGNLWYNATPLDTATWSQISADVSTAGIDTNNEVYYLTTAAELFESDGGAAGTLISPAQTPKPTEANTVLSFKMGGPGNVNVYYQVADGTIFDWTDNSVTNPYGVNVGTGGFTSLQPTDQSGETDQNGEYAVGSNGALYVVGEARVEYDAALTYTMGVKTATASSTAAVAELGVGEEVLGDGGKGFSAGNKITAINGLKVTFTTAPTQTHTGETIALGYPTSITANDGSNTGTATSTTNLFVGEEVDSVVNNFGFQPGDVITAITGDKVTFSVAATSSTTSQYLFGDASDDRVLVYTPPATAGTPGTQSQFFAAGTGTAAAVASVSIYEFAGTPDVGGSNDVYFLAATNTLGATKELDELFSLTIPTGVTTVLTGLKQGTATGSLEDLGVSGNTDSAYVIEEINVVGGAPNGLPASATLYTSGPSGPASALDVNAVNGGVPDYKIGPAGAVIVEQAGGVLVQYDSATPTGGVIDDNGATNIFFSSNGGFYEQKGNGNLWLFTNGKWTEIDTGGTVASGITPNGGVYEFKGNGNLWEFLGGSSTATATWSLVSANVTSFEIASPGQLGYPSILGESFGNSDTTDGQVVYAVASGSVFFQFPSPESTAAAFQVITGGAYLPTIEGNEDNEGNLLEAEGVPPPAAGSTIFV